MSIRMRSAVGAVFLCGGVLLTVGGGIYAKPVLFWASGAAVLLGAAVIAWAVRDAVREIGHAQAKFDAMLRAEAESQKREQNPPDTR